MRPDSKTTELEGITDLTVLAPIKEEFVKGAFETETKVERLRRVLTVLNILRQVSREVALLPSPFADSIGRFQTIHFFRFAILPPESVGQAPGSAHRLLLNVTFDGGWEPYMRVIWKPLGTLLDLIFCHCVGYPLAHGSTFDEYMRWVRKNEVQSAFFYSDQATTVADQNYLAQLEALQRERGGEDGADALAAGLALPGQPPTVIPTPSAVETALQVLKSLAGLRPLFPPNTDLSIDIEEHPEADEDGILRRFTSDLLRDLRGWIAQGLFDPGQRFDLFRKSFDAERTWLMTPGPLPKPKTVANPLSLVPAAVQAGVAEPFNLPPTAIHGALVLLRITDAAKTMDWLAKAPVTTAADAIPDGSCALTLALTCAGLMRLGVPKEELDKLPREFIDGMEARAGILGDVRGNHPQYWSRPLAWKNPRTSPRVELSTVHVLVQLRTAELQADEKTDGVALLKRLYTKVLELETGTGLSIQSVQAMKQRSVEPGLSAGRDNFGFVDGISQPSLKPAGLAPSYWDDRVKAGELFLGHANDRGDDAIETRNTLLDNGSFLVVRKLRQNVGGFDQLVKQAAHRLAPDSPKQQDDLRELFRSKMLGRSSDGAPMLGSGGAQQNDFDYRSDPAGKVCPFSSHIRRANPREPRPQQMPPRIARRGMSYGRLPTQAEPTAEHGLVFMAYNASIAEQFEMIQRWLAGGNSSGVCSAESDPFVGVPEAGRRRVFRFVHDDKVMRLDLGDQPIVKLEWGLYAFVPSIAALKGMKDIVAPPAAKKGPPDKADGDAAKNPPAPAPPPAPLDDLGAWQRLLEDGRHRATAWKFVRDNGGVLSTAYGTLVGSPEAVLDVLKDDGGSFSASGYGERMEKSISQVDGKKGRGYLGQDDVSPHAGHQLPYVEEVNAAIERAVSEQDAFDAAHRFATGGLQRLQAAALAGAGPSRRTSVDITVLMGGVVAALCHLWFGLPDEKLVMTGPRSDDPNAPAQCPGHLIAVSRYIFSPHPSAVVEGTAIPQGISFAEAVRKFLQAGAPSGAAITKAILDAMPEDSAADAKVRTVAGVMLGFPPTVLGNLLTVLMDWTDTHRLWDMQQELTALRSAGDPLDHAHVQARLREPLLETMAKAPVPYMDWRTAAKDGNLAGCPVTSGKRVVVGLGSAVQVDNASRMLMFGGSRRAGQNDKTIHACPGYHLAVGVMLGCITALLTAGELRPTPNPRVLTLIG